VHPEPGSSTPPQEPSPGSSTPGSSKHGVLAHPQTLEGSEQGEDKVTYTRIDDSEDEGESSASPDSGDMVQLVTTKKEKDRARESMFEAK
jgi:hypothetical protein